MDCKGNERVIEKNWEWDSWAYGVLSDEGPAAVQMLTHTHTQVSHGPGCADLLKFDGGPTPGHYDCSWCLIYSTFCTCSLPASDTHTNTHTHSSTCMLIPESNPSSTGWQPITQHPLPVCVSFGAVRTARLSHSQHHQSLVPSSTRFP